MKLQHTLNHVQSDGVLATIKYGIDPSAVGHITEMLIHLYERPVEAVIREYLNNALDAHTLAGETGRKIDLWLPTCDYPTLSVRDYGLGLARAAFERQLLQIGASGDEKRLSNEYIGGFGVGGKCAYAVADSFTFTVWHGGMERVYQSHKDEHGESQSSMLSERASTEPTGIRIDIPVKSGQEKSFVDAAEVVLTGWEPGKVRILRGEAKDRKIGPAGVVRHFATDVKLNDTDVRVSLATLTDVSEAQLNSWSTWTCLWVKQGLYYYSIDAAGYNIPSEWELQSCPVPASRYDYGVNKYVRNGQPEPVVLIEAPVGTFPLTPSREALRASEFVKKSVLELAKQARKLISEKLRVEVKACQALTEAVAICTPLAPRDSFFGPINWSSASGLQTGSVWTGTLKIDVRRMKAFKVKVGGRFAKKGWGLSEHDGETDVTKPDAPKYVTVNSRELLLLEVNDEKDVSLTRARQLFDQLAVAGNGIEPTDCKVWSDQASKFQRLAPQHSRGHGMEIPFVAMGTKADLDSVFGDPVRSGIPRINYDLYMDKFVPNRGDSDEADGATAVGGKRIAVQHGMSPAATDVVMYVPDGRPGMHTDAGKWSSVPVRTMPKLPGTYACVRIRPGCWTPTLYAAGKLNDRGLDITFDVLNRLAEFVELKAATVLGIRDVEAALPTGAKSLVELVEAQVNTVGSKHGYNVTDVKVALDMGLLGVHGNVAVPEIYGDEQIVCYPEYEHVKRWMLNVALRAPAGTKLGDALRKAFQKWFPFTWTKPALETFLECAQAMQRIAPDGRYGCAQELAKPIQAELIDKITADLPWLTITARPVVELIPNRVFGYGVPERQVKAMKILVDYLLKAW